MEANLDTTTFAFEKSTRFSGFCNGLMDSQLTDSDYKEAARFVLENMQAQNIKPLYLTQINGTFMERLTDKAITNHADIFEMRPPQNMEFLPYRIKKTIYNNYEVFLENGKQFTELDSILEAENKLWVFEVKTSLYQPTHLPNENHVRLFSEISQEYEIDIFYAIVTNEYAAKHIDADIKKTLKDLGIMISYLPVDKKEFYTYSMRILTALNPLLTKKL